MRTRKFRNDTRRPRVSRSDGSRLPRTKGKRADSGSFNLIMISAMYENGGNVVHRHLDGHPELLTYPFESQPGTRYVSDELTSLFPCKYRWPVFPVEGDPHHDFELLFDEEYKTRVRRPDGSKFRDADLQVSEAERKKYFMDYMVDRKRTTGNLVTAYFYASFAAWKNCRKTGSERCYVGYSPIIGVDADRIFADLPDAKIVHVVRNPIAAFSETRRRPFPLSLDRYVWTWNIVQHKSLVFQEKYPDQYIILRYEDVLADLRNVMEKLADSLEIAFDESLLYPSWNGERLAVVSPWGTIDCPQEEEQKERKEELTPEQRSEIIRISSIFAERLGYDLTADDALQLAHDGA